MTKNYNSNKKLEYLTISIIIILFVITTLNFIHITPVLLWDEPVYLSNAKYHLTQTYFTEDFRFPLLEYFIAGLWIFTGISILSTQMLMITFSIITILFYYLISKYIIKMGLMRILGVILFSFSSIFLYWSYRIYSDIPSLCFILGTIYFFFKYLDNKTKENLQKSNRFIFLAGICTATAFLFKYPGAILALIIIPYLLFNKKYKNLIIYSLGNGIILSFWLIHNIIKYSNPLWDLIAQASIINLYTSNQPLTIFFYNFLITTGLLILFLVAFIIYYIKNNEYKNNIYLNTILSTLILSLSYYMFGVKLKLLRYQLMLIPFTIILATWGLSKLISNILSFKENKTKTKILLILILLIICVCNILIQYSKTYEIIHDDYQLFSNSAFLDSINYAETNIPEGKLIISNYWTWYGFYGNHKARSLWSYNISEILDEEIEGYIFLNQYTWDNTDIQKLEFNGYIIKNFTDEKNNSVIIYKVYN